MPARRAPGEGGAFLVCTYDLTRQRRERGRRGASSARRRTLVGAELLSWSRARSARTSSARYAQLAALRPTEPVVLPLRLLADEHDRIGTLAARIATCGPPRAALVTVQPSGFGRR